MSSYGAVAQAVGMFQIREMRHQDVAAAARLHHQYLPDGFFARLGQPFLARYYETFMSGAAVALVAVHDGEVIGMAVGTSNDGLHYRQTVRCSGRQLAFSAAWALLWRPRLAARFLRTRFRRYARGFRKLSGDGAAKPQAISGSLVHIAVAPQARGTGVGKALVETYVTAVAKRGITRPKVVTKADNVGAITFYETLGWKRSGTSCDLDGNEFVRLEFGNISRNS